MAFNGEVPDIAPDKAMEGSWLANTWAYYFPSHDDSDPPKTYTPIPRLQVPELPVADDPQWQDYNNKLYGPR